MHRAVADACGMLHSGLQDVFTVHLDWRSQIVGVSVSTPDPAAATTKDGKGDSYSSSLGNEEGFNTK